MYIDIIYKYIHAHIDIQLYIYAEQAQAYVYVYIYICVYIHMHTTPYNDTFSMSISTLIPNVKCFQHWLSTAPLLEGSNELPPQHQQRWEADVPSWQTSTRLNSGLSWSSLWSVNHPAINDPVFTFGINLKTMPTAFELRRFYAIKFRDVSSSHGVSDGPVPSWPAGTKKLDGNGLWKHCCFWQIFHKNWTGCCCWIMLNLFTDQFQQMKRMKRAPGLPLEITTVLHFNMPQPIAGHVQRKAKHLSQNAVPTLRLGHPKIMMGLSLAISTLQQLKFKRNVQQITSCWTWKIPNANVKISLW